jgi:methyltransferase
MVTELLFTALVGATAVQRGLELQRSGRNEREILARGGREHVAHQMAWMRLVHTAWFVAMLAEVWLLDRPLRPAMAAVALAVFAGGQWLRHLAMTTLGWRWSVRVYTVPGMPAAGGGIYRYLRHPNYCGVVLELLALPLVHGAWMTAIAFTVANAVLLRARIPAEEAALRRNAHLGHDAPDPS